MNLRPGFNNRQTVFGLALLTAWLPATLAMAQMSYRYSGSTTASQPISDSTDISSSLGGSQSSSTYTPPRAGSRAALEQHASSDDAVQPTSVLKMPDEPSTTNSSASNSSTTNPKRVYTAQRTSAQSAEAVKPRTYTSSAYRQPDSTMPPAPPVISGQATTPFEETSAPTGSLFSGPHSDQGAGFMGNGGCGCGHCPPGGGSCASCNGGCNSGGCGSDAYGCGFGIGSFFSNLFSCDCNSGCGGCNGGGCASGACNGGGCNNGGCSSGMCGNSGGCNSGSCNGGGCSSGSCNGGGCGSCNGNGGFGICIGFCNCNLMDNLTAYAGPESFRGPLDGDNGHGNFGFHEGLNTGFCISECLGLGLQIGGELNEADFEPTFVTDQRTQIFLTGGAFHRPTCGRGWEFGVVIDYLHDDFYEQFDLAQIRGRVGYEFGCNTLGFEFSQHLDSESYSDPRGILFFAPGFVGSFGGQDRYVAMLSHRFCEGAEGRIYGGLTSYSDGIVGADIRAPLSDSWSLQASFDYLMPEGGVGAAGALPGNSAESWNVGCSLEWHPHGRAHCYSNDPYRPMFDVANNGSFMLKLR